MVVLKAYDILPAQEAMILNYTWPINITVLSILFLGQKLNLRIVIGLALAFIGVIVIVTRGNIYSLEFHNTLGVILALGSSYIWAIYWVLNLKDGRSELVKLFAAFFYGTIYIFIYVLFFDSFILDNYIYLAGAVYVGLFEMGITFFLWLKGLQLSSNKAKTATLVYISPFLSIIFIALVLNEKIFLSSLVGLFFIIVGILFQHIYIVGGKLKFKI
jgi:drug/metabolite transporter (DMT)-like permease